MLLLRSHRPAASTLPRRTLASCVIAFSLSTTICAQSPAPAATDSRDGNVYVGQSASDRNVAGKLVRNIVYDQKHIWTSPFHINKSNAKWWILAGLGTAGLLAADHQTSQALPTSGTSVDFGTSASRAGQWYSVFPAAGAMYGIGLLSHDEKLEGTGLESVEALADADIVTGVIKYVARRQRPLDGDRGGHFEKGGSSFPSGHSTQAWALASVIADEYGNHKWVPFVAYGYASLISTSRVLAQAHFTSDVFVGGAIGFFVGRYVVRTQHLHHQRPESLRSALITPSVSPSFSSIAKSISLTWSY